VHDGKFDLGPRAYFTGDPPFLREPIGADREMTVWIRGRSAYRLRRSNSARRDRLGLVRGQVRTHAQPSACQEWANERLLAEAETVTTSSLKLRMEPLVGVETIAGTAGTAALRYKKRR
jgi:hypothetical protein